MTDRILAVMKARLREFYRDRAGLGWNLVMPLVFVVAFAVIFDEDANDVLKVGVLNGGHPVSASLQAYLGSRHINFVDFVDREEAIIKVRRHQLDLLLDLQDQPSYWINQYSAKGEVAEKLLLAAFATPVDPPVRVEVEGRDIRYVDWVMPGILAMNMMFSCLWGVGWVVVRYRKNGVLRRLQATPLTAFEFVTAQVLSRLLTVTGVTLVVYLVAAISVDFTMRGSYLVLFLVFLSGAACLTGLGLLVATRIRSEELADGLLNVISWPMMILSGVWFSLEGTTPAAQTVSALFPLTHLVSAARQVMLEGAGLSQVLGEIGLLLALTLGLLLLSARLFRWN
ncbi:MAG: ABC transporter permease [Pseudomonadota bacterium]